MFFNLFSALSLKKTTAATTQPTGRQPKPAQPAATPSKKPSALGRVLKALKTPLSKTRHRKYPPIKPAPLECFLTPREGFDPYNPYPTLSLADFPAAAPTLPNPTFTFNNASLLSLPRSAIATPTTVDSGYLSAPTPERSPRPSDNLTEVRRRSANSIVPPVDDVAGKRGPTAEARQLAIDRLVEALEAGPQNAQTLRFSEVDRLWDAEEAKALAKEEEENAKRRARRSDLQVKTDSQTSSHDRPTQERLQRERRDSRDGRDYRDRYPASRDCVPPSAKCANRVTTRWEPTRAGLPVEDHSIRERVESPATRQRLLAGRGVSGFSNEGSRDEDDDSYEGPFALESPGTRQRYLALSSRA